MKLQRETDSAGIPGDRTRVQRSFPVCQSCGTDLSDRKLWGTGRNKSALSEYCVFCYKDGSFIEPALTMEEMGWRIHRVLVQQGGMTARESTAIIDGILPKLRRWQGNGG